MKAMMTLRTLVPTNRMTETIARFGDGFLVRLADGRFLLEGGSERDRLAAREWAAHFLHEAAHIGRASRRG